MYKRERETLSPRLGCAVTGRVYRLLNGIPERSEIIFCWRGRKWDEVSGDGFGARLDFLDYVLGEMSPLVLDSGWTSWREGAFLYGSLYKEMILGLQRVISSFSELYCFGSVVCIMYVPRTALARPKWLRLSRKVLMRNLKRIDSFTILPSNFQRCQSTILFNILWISRWNNYSKHNIERITMTRVRFQ